MIIHRTIYEKSVFLDTGALIALINSKDVHHAEAQDCIQLIERLNLPVFVSNVTIIETHKRILFDISYSRALKFLNDIYDESVNILRLNKDDEREAKRIIQKFSDHVISFADAVNFAIMKRIGIAKAFAFDKDYTIVGFDRIPPYY